MPLSDRDYEQCLILGALMARIIIENCCLLGAYRAQREADTVTVGMVRWELPGWYKKK